MRCCLSKQTSDSDITDPQGGDEKVMEADAVVVTLPLGVLKRG